jgi:hypothetical protein
VPGNKFVVLPLSSSYLIDGIVDDLDGMELVEGDGCIGQAVGSALDEGRAHVDADLGDGIIIVAVRPEIIGKCCDGLSVLAFGREDDAGAVDIDKQLDVMVAAWGGGLSLPPGLTGGTLTFLTPHPTQHTRGTWGHADRFGAGRS